jgi:hypothetical protein
MPSESLIAGKLICFLPGVYRILPDRGRHVFSRKIAELDPSTEPGWPPKPGRGFAKDYRYRPIAIMSAIGTGILNQAWRNQRSSYSGKAKP